MTGFQPVLSLFPTQGTTASGTAGGGSNTGAADLFTQMLSGMVDANTSKSQSDAFFSTASGSSATATGASTGMGATAGQFTASSNLPFVTTKGAFAATGKGTAATTGAQGGTTALTSLMTNQATANDSTTAQSTSPWSETHWTAKSTGTQDSDSDGDAATDTKATGSKDDNGTDTTMAAMAAIMPLPQTSMPITTTNSLTAAGAAAQATDATAGAQAAVGAQAGGTQAGTQADAKAATAPDKGFTLPPDALPTGDGAAGDLTADEKAAVDAALTQAGATKGASSSGVNSSKGTGAAATTAANSLSVADQKAAALAVGTDAAVQSKAAQNQTQAQAQAKTTATGSGQAMTAADAAALTAGTTTTDSAAKAGGNTSGSGIKTGTGKSGTQVKGDTARGDTVKLQAANTSVTSATASQGAAAADQGRPQVGSATDDDASNGLTTPAGDSLAYADYQTAATATASAPIATAAKVGTDAAQPAALAMPTIGSGGTGATPATNPQAVLQAMLQQQTGRDTATASNGLLSTASGSGMLAAESTESTKSSTASSSSDATLAASGLLGLTDGQHLLGNDFATQAAAANRQVRQTQYPPVLQQVTMGFQKAASNGLDSVTIQLTPEDMGTIDVKLDFHKDGKVRASVTTDNAKTLDLLQRNSSDLQKSLQDAGLQTDGDSLSFSLKDDGQAAQQQQERRSSGQGNGRFSMDDAGTTDDVVPESTIIPSLGRVDVRI
ncbi:MAG: flagellar hook-length control protein FliK [Azospirillaceae bacterium]|nr:flagellar hook-length control protein FliK [Azospirillaceae bacterium]